MDPLQLGAKRKARSGSFPLVCQYQFYAVTAITVTHELPWTVIRKLFGTLFSVLAVDAAR